MKIIPEQEREGLVKMFRDFSPMPHSPERPILSAQLEKLWYKKTFPPFRAVLFDVYGTLLLPQTGRQISPVVDRAAGELVKELNSLGYPGGIEDFSQDIDGIIDKTNSETKPLYAYPEVDIEAIILGRFPVLSQTQDQARKIAVLLECVRNPCSPMPGAKKLLEALVAAGIPLGYVSNAQFYTPLLLEGLFSEPLGSRGVLEKLCFFSYEFGFSKPEPKFFEKASRSLGAMGIAAGETLVLGNSAENDTAPAKKQGFLTALVARDRHTFYPPRESWGEEELPDMVITDLEVFAREIY